MSNKSIVRYLAVLLFAVFASAVLVVADLSALAQNSNSSTTQDDSMMMKSAPMKSKRRGRRGRRRPPAPPADTSMPADTGMAADTGTQSPGEQTDLSGTYTGHVTLTGGHEMDGQGTLTINGNQFTLESEGMSHSGRVYAVTTRGYTGLSMYFSDLTDSTSNTPVVAMGRAKKSGDRLTIMRVPGARTGISFGSAAGGGGRRGRRGRRAATPETTPMETAPTADAPATGSDSMAPADGAMNANTGRRSRSRRGRRRGGASNMNSNMNSNTGDNSNMTPPML